MTDGTLELAVRDDGAGFGVAKTLDRAASRGHLGLLGMKERVQILVAGRERYQPCKLHPFIGE
jgi:signal transduction histidine kinase